MQIEPVRIKAHVDRETKKNAEKIIKALGLTPSAAIEAFYRAVISQKGMSFLFEIPNEETEKALATPDEEMISVGSVTELFEEMKKW